MKKKKAIPSKSKKPVLIPPIRSESVPVTAKMLCEMEGRLCKKFESEIHSVKSEMQGIKAELKLEIHEIKSELHGLKSEIQVMKSEIKSEFHEVKSDISEIKSELHRVALLVEEQNARNKYVLDGYSQLYDLIAKRERTR